MSVEKKLEKAIRDFLSGEYSHPRRFRPNQCPHGMDYWKECDACNTIHFESALRDAGLDP